MLKTPNSISPPTPAVTASADHLRLQAPSQLESRSPVWLVVQINALQATRTGWKAGPALSSQEMHRAEREAEETGVAPEIIHAPAHASSAEDAAVSAITVTYNFILAKLVLWGYGHCSSFKAVRLPVNT